MKPGRPKRLKLVGWLAGLVSHFTRNCFRSIRAVEVKLNIHDYTWYNLRAHIYTPTTYAWRGSRCRHVVIDCYYSRLGNLNANRDNLLFFFFVSRPMLIWIDYFFLSRSTKQLILFPFIIGIRVISDSSQFTSHHIYHPWGSI